MMQILVETKQHSRAKAMLDASAAARDRLFNPINAKYEVEHGKIALAKALGLLQKQRDALLEKYNEQLALNEVLRKKYQDEQSKTAMFAAKVIELQSHVDSLVADELKTPFPQPRKVPKLKAQILKWCNDNGIDYDSIVGGSRVSAVMKMRNQCVYDIYKANHPYKSYTEIGRAFGGRDHSTIIQAVRKMKARDAGQGTQ